MNGNLVNFSDTERLPYTTKPLVESLQEAGGFMKIYSRVPVHQIVREESVLNGQIAIYGEEILMLKKDFLWTTVQLKISG